MALTKIGDAGMPAGAVLQVVTVEKADTFTTGSQTFVDITGFSASITPISSSSKIMVFASISIGFSTASFNYARLLRDSTELMAASSPGSRPSAGFTAYGTNDGIMHRQTLCVLDSPSTSSAITYKVQMRVAEPSQTGYFNRSERDTNAANNDPRSASSITVMEIAG